VPQTGEAHKYNGEVQQMDPVRKYNGWTWSGGAMTGFSQKYNKQIRPCGTVVGLDQVVQLLDLGNMYSHCTFPICAIDRPDC
jgi:hypothetical protein